MVTELRSELDTDFLEAPHFCNFICGSFIVYFISRLIVERNSRGVLISVTHQDFTSC